MKIYVASSWRNERQPETVRLLREDGHEVYDFRSSEGFNWKQVDESYESQLNVLPGTYVQMLAHPLAQQGFKADLDAMRWADACVLDLPCGLSAHLEVGWFIGQWKLVVILLNGPLDPELMYLLANKIVTNHDELMELFKGFSA